MNTEKKSQKLVNRAEKKGFVEKFIGPCRVRWVFHAAPGESKNGIISKVGRTPRWGIWDHPGLSAVDYAHTLDKSGFSTAGIEARVYGSNVLSLQASCSMENYVEHKWIAHVEPRFATPGVPMPQIIDGIMLISKRCVYQVYRSGHVLQWDVEKK